MAKPEQFSAQDMIDALTKTKGMVTLAARELRCASNTVRRYIREYPTVAAAQHEARETLGDNVEITLATMALGKVNPSGKYEREPNIAALIFLAKTKYKDRGYTEKIEIDVRYLAIIQQLEGAAKGAGIDLADALNDFYAELSQTVVSADAGEGASGG